MVTAVADHIKEYRDEALGISATPEQHRAAAKRLGGPTGYVLT
jgi:hypothetical protein